MKQKNASRIIWASVLLAFFFSAYDLGMFSLDFSEFLSGFLGFFNQPPTLDGSTLRTGLVSLLETIEIALVGTVLGMAISLPLSLFSSRNIFNRRVVVPARLLLASIRTLPSIIWALILVAVLGVGPRAGAVATAFYTAGYLGKLGYEAIESADREVLEAVYSLGASKLQLVRFAVLPLSANHLLSQAMFMFEYNVRASSILGFVGAGGIGFYLLNYVKLLEYGKVLALLIMLFIVVLLLDFLSTKIRGRFLSINPAVR